MRRGLVGFSLVLGLITVSSCQPEPRNGFRAMTYNVEWFNEEASPERIGKLKAILDSVRPDVVALQEVQSRAALTRVFGDDWDLAIQDDPNEYQELAIAVRKPAKIEDYNTLFRDTSLDEAFPGSRDVLRVPVVLGNGQRIVFYTLHMKSRRGGRLQTDYQREMAAGILAAYLKSRKDESQVVLGDFNDAPDDVSLNILESGNLKIGPGRPSVPQPLLINLMEPLYDRDEVTLGLADLFRGSPISARVAGAKAENERWRGKDYDFGRDVNIKQSLFDQILVSPNLRPRVQKVAIFIERMALEGERGRVRVEEGGTVRYLEQGTRASDHLPVYVEIRW